MSDDPYDVRFYQRADRDSFLDLYESVMGECSEEWFEWKYVANPFVSHVPIVVADHEGDVVAARPQVPFRMRAGEDRPLALRFGDTIVHADHRRKGLFTRTTERAMEYYADQPPEFAFNFPNQLSEPGYLKLGGHVVQELTSYYRLQGPAATLARSDAGRAVRVAGRAADVAAGIALDALDRARRTPDDLRVLRYTDPPPDLFADLYERNVPRRIHAERNEQFYRWRFENPRWEYHGYVVYDDRDEALAGAVTGTQTTAGETVTNVMEVVPLVDDGRRAGRVDDPVRARAGPSAVRSGDVDRDRAVDVLLGGVLADNEDADTVVFAGGTVDRSLLRRHGFVPDDRVPLSRVASPSRHVAYDLSGEGDRPWTVAGLDIRHPSNWALSLSEHDSR